MAIRLFCRVAPHTAERILTEGFPHDSRGGVWLSRDADTVADATGCVLAVNLEIPEDLLEMYGVDVPADLTWDDETWDETAGRWVKRTDGDARGVHWYEVPPSMLNRVGTVHVRSHSELARLGFLQAAC